MLTIFFSDDQKYTNFPNLQNHYVFFVKIIGFGLYRPISKYIYLYIEEGFAYRLALPGEKV